MAECIYDRTEFNADGFQAILNGSGVKTLGHMTASAIVGRMDGLAYERGITGTASGYGPRPIWVVFAHKFPDPIRQLYANRRLEGAM